MKLGRYSKPGSAPGILSVDPDAQRPIIRVMAYNPDRFEEREIADPAELESIRGEWPVVWVDVHGLGDRGTLEALGARFELHPLALEDVVNLGQRAKVEPYDEDLFIIARMPADPPSTEQISLFLGRDFVLTFQEQSGDCLEGVRERIRHGRGRIRRSGPDYLSYAILDAVIDAYFPVVDELGDQLEQLEEEVLDRPDQDTVTAIHRLRRTILTLRKSVAPHREAFNALIRGEGPFVTHETTLFLRDCYDHVIRVVELLEAYREISSDLMATYLSSVSNKMNEVMKVLTIIATIFIPLGFIAGLYGMNFDAGVSPWNMPELGWYLGYPFALLLMLLVATGFLVFVWRRGWFR
jgi:magnesium transporter